MNKKEQLLLLQAACQSYSYGELLEADWIVDRSKFKSAQQTFKKHQYILHMAKKPTPPPSKQGFLYFLSFMTALLDLIGLTEYEFLLCEWWLRRCCSESCGVPKTPQPPASFVAPAVFQAAGIQPPPSPILFTTNRENSDEPQLTPDLPTPLIQQNLQLFEAEMSRVEIPFLKIQKTKKERWCEDEKRLHFETKKELWMKMEKEIGIKMGYSTFCRRARAIKKAKKRVDVCNMCCRLALLKKRKCVKKMSDAERMEMEALLEHAHEAQLMRSAFHRDVDELNVGDVLVLMDFKQDWQLPMDRVETSRDFYSRQAVSHLCVIVMTKVLENGGVVRKKSCYHYLSEVMSKDIRFVDGCLRASIEEESARFAAVDNGGQRRLKVWVDGGTHFKNGFLLQSLFGDHPTSLRHSWSPSLNFFAEGHGKSECDAEFGVLSSQVKIKAISIQTIDDLHAFFTTHCRTNRSFQMFAFVILITLLSLLPFTPSPQL